jgi:hypothetical protein
MHSGSSALLTIGSDFEKREDGIDRPRFARPTGSIETGMLCDAFGDLDTGAHGRAAAAKAAEDQRQAHFPRLFDGKGNAIPLTQEFLGQMLGVLRTMTLAAQLLQSAGLIRYRRGHIQILDRPDHRAFPP